MFAGTRTAIVVGMALVGLSLCVHGAAASTPVERFCVKAFPSASSTTTGGVTLYNREASVQAVECNDFGFGESFHLSLTDVCSLLAGAIGVKFDKTGVFIDGSCSGTEMSNQHDVGTASGVICGMLSDLLIGKPWAKAFGVAAGVACTFGEPTGSWIESKREQRTAEAIWANHKCIKYARHSFPRTDRWAAVACASTDRGFASSPTIKPPTIIVYDKPKVKPKQITISGDGSLVLGGADGTGQRPNFDFGSLRWTTWTGTDATAVGAEWVNDCVPDCAGGTFSPHAITLRASAPINGRFTKLTVRGTDVVSDDADKHTEITLSPHPNPPGYTWLPDAG